MQRMVRTLLVFSLVALLVSPLTAQEEKKKKKRNKQRGGGNVAAQLFGLRGEQLASLELTAEQKEKVEALVKAHVAKFREVAKEQRSVLTEEQIQARNEARKKAADDGKKGRELQQAANAAVQLSDEQKQKMTELGKKRRELQQTARKALEEILTDEQKAKIKTRAKKQRKKKDAAGE